MSEPALWIEVAAAVAAALASAVGVIVGFGSALLLAPLLLMIYPAAQVAANPDSTGSRHCVAFLRRRCERPSAAEGVPVALLWMLAGAAVATAPGVYLVTVVPQRAAQVLLGVISLVAVALLSQKAKERRRLPDPVAGAAGVASQVAASITGVGGPPLMLHLLLSGWDLRRGRMTYGVFFIVANAFIAASLIVSGAAHPLWSVVAAGSAATVAALPTRIRIDSNTLRTALISMTAVSGVVVLLRGLI
jgi:uncharacterized protein